MFKTAYYNRDVFEKERSKSSRFRFWIFLLGLLVLGSALIGLSYTVLYSDVLRVKSVKVEGLRSVSDERFIAALSVEFSKKWPLALLGRENILFWALGRKKGNLAQNLPAIEGVEIHPDLVRKEIVLNVRERELLGIWCFPSRGCYAFDKEGIVFAETPFSEGVLILKISDENSRPVVLGAPIFGNNKEWLKNILVTLGILEEIGWKPVSLQIRNLSLREWQVGIPAGLTLYFSLDFVPDALENTLANLKSKLKLDKLTYLDFRVPSRIYYK